MTPLHYYVRNIWPVPNNISYNPLCISQLPQFHSQLVQFHSQHLSLATSSTSLETSETSSHKLTVKDLSETTETDSNFSNVYNTCIQCCCLRPFAVPLPLTYLYLKYSTCLCFKTKICTIQRLGIRVKLIQVIYKKTSLQIFLASQRFKVLVIPLHMLGIIADLWVNLSPAAPPHSTSSKVIEVPIWCCRVPGTVAWAG